MGKEGGSAWLSALKKAIHAHIHGDIDEDIVRFPHLPHKKVHPSPAVSGGPSIGSSSSGVRKTCSCSCGHAHVSYQGPQVDGSARSHGSDSSGGRSRSISPSDCRSSTGSCSMTCLSTTTSKRIHPMAGDRSLSPTEEPILQMYDDDTEALRR